MGDNDNNIILQSLLSFNLPSISSANIISAFLKIYYVSYLNGPFNFGNLLYEHITSDYTPIDGGDYKAYSAITPTGIFITSAQSTDTWVTVDVTSLVKNDLSNGRSKSQYRLYFAADSNNNNAWDYCTFYSADSPINKPYLEITYY